MTSLATIAIPTLDAGAEFELTLAAVIAQRTDAEVELLVCDSGSRDATVPLARRYGAEVIQIERQRFSHGGTRNLLMQHARGDHVALLTQDAVPASDRWLDTLLNAFSLVPNAGLAFGPYRPDPRASTSVSRELTAWFASFSDGDRPRVDVLSPAERTAPPRYFLGQRGFFTDANGCIERAAWEQVPFRHVSYAEDHLLAQDMLRAGFAKVFMPTAAVIHSHDYSAVEWLRRSFDEARAMREVYDWVEPASLRAIARNLWGRVAGDWRWGHTADSSTDGAPPLALGASAALVGESILHHGARTAGSLLGSRADRLPPALVRRLSLERRGR